MTGSDISIQLMLNLIAYNQIQACFMGSFNFTRLSTSKELENYDKSKLSCLKTVFSTGGPVSNACEETLLKMFPNQVNIVNIYGLTETSSMSLSPNFKMLGTIAPGTICCVSSYTRLMEIN